LWTEVLIMPSSRFSRFLRLGLGQCIAWDEVFVSTGRRSLDHTEPLMASRKQKGRKCSFLGRGYGELARHTAAGEPLKMGPASSGIIKQAYSRDLPYCCIAEGARQRLTDVRVSQRGADGAAGALLKSLSYHHHLCMLFPSWWHNSECMHACYCGTCLVVSTCMAPHMCACWWCTLLGQLVQIQHVGSSTT